MFYSEIWSHRLKKRLNSIKCQSMLLRACVLPYLLLLRPTLTMNNNKDLYWVGFLYDIQPMKWIYQFGIMHTFHFYLRCASQNHAENLSPDA